MNSVAGGTLQALLALLTLVAVACTQSHRDVPIGDGPDPELQIVAVRTAGDLLVGSVVAVEVRGLEVDGDLILDVRSSDGTIATSLTEGRLRTTSEVEFLVAPQLLSLFGTGERAVSLTLLEGERFSVPFAATWTLADSGHVFLQSVPSGGVFRNEVAVLSGDGFYTSDEATVEATFQGTFTPEQGAAVAVSVRLPVTPAERLSRERGLVRLTTAIGGLGPGRFQGTIEVVATGPGWGATSGPDFPVDLQFLRPALFELTPDAPVLGQLVTLRGGGFVGSDDEPDEATLMRLEGTFTSGAGDRVPIAPAEVVVVYESGSQASWGIELEEGGLGLVSSFFGYRTGVFEGTATIVAIKGTDEIESDATPVTLELAGVRQIVHVTFLPGFFDSLRHYGLSSAALELRERVRDRIQAIYGDYAVDIVLEPPLDFLPGAYARVEIGGPDPNGLGLLGYDNTPGKDVGNLRLFDSIGGTNAETQSDGFPGFGGVFIDSFLYWSEDPGLHGERPFGAPQPDALFDAIFDPVRNDPATLDEVGGAGTDARRLREVEHAVTALANMIGETTAHEIGHSLGLAQPFGPVDAYHTPLAGDGCLMDAGGDRPLGERAGEPGYAEPHFCYDEPEYLEQILPR